MSGYYYERQNWWPSKQKNLEALEIAQKFQRIHNHVMRLSIAVPSINADVELLKKMIISVSIERKQPVLESVIEICSEIDESITRAKIIAAGYQLIIEED